LVADVQGRTHVEVTVNGKLKETFGPEREGVGGG